MSLTNSRLVQYLADGYTVLKISTETGINNRCLEKKIVTLRKVSKSKTQSELVANYFRQKLIE